MNKKEEFTVNGKTYLTVQPCGMLYTQGREYFLLHPFPIEPDWENEIFERRFVVVPRKQVDQLEDTGDSVYPVARHIVATAPWLIDYNDMPLIILENAEFDLANVELPVRDVNDYIREEQEWYNETFQDVLSEMEKLDLRFLRY